MGLEIVAHHRALVFGEAGDIGADVVTLVDGIQNVGDARFNALRRDAVGGVVFELLFAALSAHEPLPKTAEAAAYFESDGPATLLIEEVEGLWAPIAERDDWSAFAAKLDAIADMSDAYGPPSGQTSAISGTPTTTTMIESGSPSRQ